MPDINPLLTNSALEDSIKESTLKSETKELLISKLPDLEEEDRLELVDFLKTIFFLDEEKEEMKARVRKFEETGKFE